MVRCAFRESGILTNEQMKALIVTKRNVILKFYRECQYSLALEPSTKVNAVKNTKIAINKTEVRIREKVR